MDTSKSLNVSCETRRRSVHFDASPTTLIVQEARAFSKDQLEEEEEEQDQSHMRAAGGGRVRAGTSEEPVNL